MANKRFDELDSELTTQPAPDDLLVVETDPAGSKTYKKIAYRNLGAIGATPANLYVDPVLGNDANSGTDAEHPLRTILAAWNKIPTIFSGYCAINLAAGDYTGQQISFFDNPILGLKYPSDSRSNIAVMCTTPNVVVANGVATGGSLTTLVDTTRSWTANEHRRRFVMFLDRGNPYYTPMAPISANTGDTLMFVDPGFETPVAENERYEIVTPGAYGLGPSYIAGQTNLYLFGLQFETLEILSRASVDVNYCVLGTATESYCAHDVQNGASGWFFGCVFCEGHTVESIGPGTYLDLMWCLVDKVSHGANTGQSGIAVYNQAQARIVDCTVQRCNGHGLHVFRGGLARLDDGVSSFIDNGQAAGEGLGYGAQAATLGQAVGASTQTYSGNASGTYHADAATFGLTT
jgi:hypothetical protein